ncbi:MAG: alpha/beta fold hydrolase [Bacteroidota bacterium]
MKPATRYTKRGRINIAYQIFGSGPVDLVYIPGWVSNIDLMWACPELSNFLSELSTIARIIIFDKRGTGLSDRISELSTLEERMDDIRAVMDAVDSERAVLFGHSEGGSVSALFAATYPDRVISLITFGIFARRKYSPDYPWAPTEKERERLYKRIEDYWGSSSMGLESLAPSKSRDKVFMDWLASYFRSGASPSAALALTKMNTELDIIDILGAIKVPVLVMQRANDIDVKLMEGRFIASRIHKAKFVELPGNDHLFWVGNTKVILDEMKAFILKIRPRRAYEERLYTIISGEIRPFEAASPSLRELINQIIIQYRGKTVLSKRGGFIAIFEGPSKAVHCSLDLTQLFKAFKAQLTIGIHIKEGAVDESCFVSDETEQFSLSLIHSAKLGEVIITETVKNLLSGSGLRFISSRIMVDPSTAMPVPLAVVESDETNYILDLQDEVFSNQEHSFLEDVLSIIDRHIDNEDLGIELLCKETRLSERHLQRKLKSITNKSPLQLITSVRLYRAKELLLSQEAGVSQAAFKVGFTSPSYFSKLFRREFGVAPSVFVERD